MCFGIDSHGVPLELTHGISTKIKELIFFYLKLLFLNLYIFLNLEFHFFNLYIFLNLKLIFFNSYIFFNFRQFARI